MIWLSSDLRFKWFLLSIDLRFNWFGCQLIWDSNDLVVNRCVLQMILVVCWFELQVMWLSIDLRFNWFGCQLIWDSSDLVVNRFEIPMSWLSIDYNIYNWFEIQVIWMSNDLRFKWCGCQTKLFCETSFKIEVLKVKNEAFLQDFLQNWSFEAQKRSFSARLPSKLKLWSSKTKHFCETSFKIEALKLQNEAFLRDFLQKWSFEAPKRSISARLPSKTKLWSSKTKHFCETSFKIDMLSRHLTSEFQYVLTIFKWMLQKYCACHEKVAPRHTNSCNCHAKWSLQSNTSVTWNLQPFHGFSIGGFKHRHHKARDHCACHAKRIVPDPLQIHHACQRFCNPHELLRLPRILQRVEIPAPATRNTLWTLKNVPRPSVFNDFDFQIALARRRGANFAKLNFQKCSEPLSFYWFWLPNRSRAQAWCKFLGLQLPKVLRHRQFLTIFTSKSLSRVGVVQILRSSTSKSAPNMPVFNDFDFQIALARRRGANFVDILGSRSSAPPRFSDLPLRTFEATKLRKNTAFRAIPTRQNLSCLTSALYNISAVWHRCCETYRQLSV